MGRMIYYFSGTGNSLCAARELAERLEAELVPMAAFRDADAVETDAEMIGLVFPVYYSDAPVIVQEFIGKLKNPESKTVFALCTHGGAAGDALRTVRKLLEKRGGRLSLAFGLPMPAKFLLQVVRKQASPRRPAPQALQTDRAENPKGARQASGIMISCWNG